VTEADDEPRQKLASILRSELAKTERGEKHSNAHILSRALLRKAKSGNIAACGLILELLDARDPANPGQFPIETQFSPEELDKLSLSDLQRLIFEEINRSSGVARGKPERGHG
jgi:hypothetical protein